MQEIIICVMPITQIIFSNEQNLSDGLVLSQFDHSLEICQPQLEFFEVITFKNVGFKVSQPHLNSTFNYELLKRSSLEV